MKDKLRDLLFRSFDGELTSDERKQLDEALNGSESLRKEQERLIGMRRALSKMRPSFRPFFAERVIQKIQTYRRRETSSDLFFESLIAFFRPVIITVIVLIIITLSVNAVRNNGNAMAGVLAQSDITLEEAFDPIYEFIEE